MSYSFPNTNGNRKVVADYTDRNWKVVADYLGHSFSILTERVYVTTSDRFMEQSIRDFAL